MKKTRYFCFLCAHPFSSHYSFSSPWNTSSKLIFLLSTIILPCLFTLLCALNSYPRTSRYHLSYFKIKSYQRDICNFSGTFSLNTLLHLAVFEYLPNKWHPILCSSFCTVSVLHNKLSKERGFFYLIHFALHLIQWC